MLNKISKLKNMGVYHDFSRDPSLADFAKKNIIYGRNGSGKSTLARLFQMLEVKDDIKNTDKSLSFPSLEFSMAGSGISINERNFKTNALHVKVFNRDFIDNNVFATNGPQPIVILSSKDATLVAEKEKLEKDLQIKRPQLASLEEEEKQAKNAVDLKYKDIGVLIKNSAISIGNYKNYDATKVKQKYSEAGLKLVILTDKELNDKITFINETLMENVSASIGYKKEEIDDLIKELNIILETTVTNITLKELQEDKSLENWVKEGLKLHEGKDTCSFCNNKISNTREQNLKDHFNNAFIKLEEDIDNFVAKIQGKIASLNKLVCPIKSLLYSDLREEFENKSKDFNSARDEIITPLEELVTAVKEKKSKMNQSYKFDKSYTDYAKDFEKIIKDIEDIIKLHNDKTLNFQNEKEERAHEIEIHYLAKEKAEIDGLIKSYDDKTLKKEALKKIIDTSDTRVLEIIGLLKDHAKAADVINGYLGLLFGRNEIKLIAHGIGYKIDRGGNSKFKPSDGEKTAIALAYFIATLEEEGCDKENCIVVIDDPVSSLDENVLYAAYSLILEKCSDCLQFFILTHHYGLLKLVLKEWVKGTSFKTNHMGYLLTSFWEATNRRSKIGELDNFLIRFESEYEYLFKELDDFANATGAISLEEAYPYSNYARKLLEGFLAFKYPNQGDLRGKLIEACKKMKTLNPTYISKETEIYRFVNVFSHNNTVNSFNDVDMTVFTNGRQVVNDIFDLIKGIDSDHYTQMKAISR